MKPDYILYLVTDRRAMSTRTLAEAVEQAIAGGCTMVQLREAETSALEFYQLAVDIKAAPICSWASPSPPPPKP